MFDKELETTEDSASETHFYTQETTTGLLMVSPTVSQRVRYLTDEDLRNLVWGLGITASGGGGSWNFALAMVEEIIKEFPNARYRPIYDPADALDSDTPIVAGAIGAPSSFDANFGLSFSRYIDYAIKEHDRHHPTERINAIIPIEAGPINILIALYAGWKFGYKVFDCDGAGRAVPSLGTLTFDFEDYDINPVYIAGQRDCRLAVDEIRPAPANGADAQKKILPHLPEYGGAAGLICWRQTGRQLRDSSILKNTVEKRIYEGTAIRTLSDNPTGMRYYIACSMYTYYDAEFTVTGYRRERMGDYDKGVYTLRGHHYEAELELANEFLLLRNLATGEIITTGPTTLQFLVQINGKYLPLNAADGPQHQQFRGRRIILWSRYVEERMYNDDVKNAFSTFFREQFGYRGRIIPPQIEHRSAVTKAGSK